MRWGQRRTGHPCPLSVTGAQTASASRPCWFRHARLVMLAMRAGVPWEAGPGTEWVSSGA